MTIPFGILRNISFTLPMPAEKRKCIDEIGYGNSCKYVLGVNQKPWRNAKQQGYTFTDLSIGARWG
jgi:monoamine oxidase